MKGGGRCTKRHLCALLDRRQQLIADVQLRPRLGFSGTTRFTEIRKIARRENQHKNTNFATLTLETSHPLLEQL